MSRRRADRTPEILAPLVAGDLDRFHQCAPAALLRRGGSFVADELGAVMLAVNGLIGLFGLFSVAGLWMMRGETAWLRDYLSRRG